jgi:hypothetical protein
MIWVSPVGHFGCGYGYIQEDLIVIEANQDGKYNVLLIGTRMDKDALESWNGPVIPRESKE